MTEREKIVADFHIALNAYSLAFALAEWVRTESGKHDATLEEAEKITKSRLVAVLGRAFAHREVN